MPAKQKISKFFVAETQFLTAIRLFFNEESPVSAYTLVRAAHEIFDRICTLKGLERSLVDRASLQLKPEKRHAFWLKINEARNFFKHADQDPDPDGEVVWSSELVALYILDTLFMYQRLKENTLPDEALCFFVWYRMKHPEYWSASPTEFDDMIAGIRGEILNMRKQDAYKLLVHACNLIRATTHSA